MQRDLDAERRPGDPDSMRAEIKARWQTQLVRGFLALFWGFATVPILVFYVARLCWQFVAGLASFSWSFVCAVGKSPRTALEASLACYQRDMSVYVTKEMVRGLK